MSDQASGILIAIMEIAGPLLLLAALIYGSIAYRRRSAAARRAGDRQTHNLYRDERQ